MPGLLLTNALLVTGAFCRKGALAIDGERIAGIWLRDGREHDDARACAEFPLAEVIDLGGKLLLAGAIDLHVHFREPGLTRKGDLSSESRAALLGGVTAFFDMPNTNPPTISEEALAAKLLLAEGRAWTHYGFHFGATNHNVGEIRAALARDGGTAFGGVKVFMGSSTGNMLVDREAALRELFRLRGKEILLHSEDEGTIQANLAAAKARWGTDIPFSAHPAVRSRSACIKSTAKALEMAMEYGTRLHILHVSTAEEVEMIRLAKRDHPGITAETSANYLWFCDADYASLGGRIKCNPAIKAEADRAALRQGVLDGTIDTIGSDHAPHLLAEKEQPYLSCPSGIPSIQHALPVVASVAQGWNAAGRADVPAIPWQRIAAACSEKAAEMMGLEERGALRVGHYADLVVLDPDAVQPADEPAYKCGWTPYSGTALHAAVKMVFLDGRLAVRDGQLLERTPLGQRLHFRNR